MILEANTFLTLFSPPGQITRDFQSDSTDCRLLRMHHYRGVSGNGHGVSHAALLPSRQLLGPNPRLDPGNSEIFR